jgi:1-acyl-sn-glycerol-3-phosphate acyltransferase
MKTVEAPLYRLPCRPSEVWTAEVPHLPGVRGLLLRAVMTFFGKLISVEGAERLARVPEPAIFALNHNSSFESIVVPMALIWLRRGRMLHFLIDWMYLHWPVIGWVMRKSDPIPVYSKPARWGLGERYRREMMRQPVLDACLDRLAAGGSLGIFPEGRRNRRLDSLLRGRPGLGEIVLRSTPPVVPVGIRFPAADRLGRPPVVGRIILVFGEPLEFCEERARAASGLPPGDRRALARAVVAHVMSEISRLSGKAVPAGLPEPAQRRLAAGGRTS